MRSEDRDINGMTARERRLIDERVLRGPPEPPECTRCGGEIEDDDNAKDGICGGCRIEEMEQRLAKLRRFRDRLLLSLGFRPLQICTDQVKVEDVMQRVAAIIDKTGAVPDTSGKQTIEHRELPPPSKEERERRKPLPPDVLLDAHNETIHRDAGRGRAARARKTRRASEGE